MKRGHASSPLRSGARARGRCVVWAAAAHQSWTLSAEMGERSTTVVKQKASEEKQMTIHMFSVAVKTALRRAYLQARGGGEEGRRGVL